MTILDLASDLKGKSILITGGSGFFGKNLCESLAKLNASQKLGMSIYALARTPVTQVGVEFIEQDVTKSFQFTGPIDLIIHAATPVVNEQSQFENIMNIIVNGTQHALEFAKRSKCSRFLLVSSGAVYGEQPADLKNIPEDFVLQKDFYNFKSAYITGKRISELMALNWAQNSGAKLTIARCFAFSGRHLPLDQHLAIGNFVQDALTNKLIKVKGDGSAIRSYMDADDLVTWLLTILLRGQSKEVYNVGSEQEITMKELASKIASMLPDTQVEIQNAIAEGSLRNRYIPSIHKAQHQLNLKTTVSLEESIQKMIDYNKGILR